MRKERGGVIRCEQRRELEEEGDVQEHHRVNCVYCPLETTMGMLRGWGAEAQEPRTYAVILIKTQTIQQATPYNQSSSDVYAELNVIWIVRSQTDGTRVAGGKLYCCVNKNCYCHVAP